LEDVRRYRETFISYLRGKDIWSKFEWITPTPPASMITADAMIEKLSGGRFKTLAAYDAWAGKQTDVKSRWDVLRVGKLEMGSLEGVPYLVANDMPGYVEKRDSVGGSLQGGAAVQLGLLAVECLFLFALAYVAFIRYDVR
jgi:hypothetical protein